MACRRTRWSLGFRGPLSQLVGPSGRRRVCGREFGLLRKPCSGLEEWNLLECAEQTSTHWIKKESALCPWLVHRRSSLPQSHCGVFVPADAGQNRPPHSANTRLTLQSRRVTGPRGTHQKPETPSIPSPSLQLSTAQTKVLATCRPDTTTAPARRSLPETPPDHECLSRLRPPATRHRCLPLLMGIAASDSSTLSISVSECDPAPRSCHCRVYRNYNIREDASHGPPKEMYGPCPSPALVPPGLARYLVANTRLTSR